MKSADFYTYNTFITHQRPCFSGCCVCQAPRCRCCNCQHEACVALWPMCERVDRVGVRVRCFVLFERNFLKNSDANFLLSQTRRSFSRRQNQASRADRPKNQPTLPHLTLCIYNQTCSCARLTVQFEVNKKRWKDFIAKFRQENFSLLHGPARPAVLNIFLKNWFKILYFTKGKKHCKLFQNKT